MNAPIHPTMLDAMKGFMPPARKRYSADFDSRVAGLPCGIKIETCTVQKPLGPNCDSDWDCFGYSNIEFTVLDSKGYEAPWLQAKLSDNDISRIEGEILESLKEEA